MNPRIIKYHIKKLTSTEKHVIKSKHFKEHQNSPRTAKFEQGLPSLFVLSKRSQPELDNQLIILQKVHR